MGILWIHKKKAYHALTLVLLLALSCGHGESDRDDDFEPSDHVPQPVSQAIGPAGGSLLTNWGDYNSTGIFIPAGALFSEIVFTISHGMVDCLPLDQCFGLVIDIEPDGTQFQVPVTISLQYFENDYILAGLDEDEITLYQCEDVENPNTCEDITTGIDKINNIVYGAALSLSYFGMAFGEAPTTTTSSTTPTSSTTSTVPVTTTTLPPTTTTTQPPTTTTTLPPTTTTTLFPVTTTTLGPTTTTTLPQTTTTTTSTTTTTTIPGAYIPGDVLIDELFYDPETIDDGWEYVILYNATGEEIDLSGWEMQWGGSDFTYGTLDLAGISLPGYSSIIMGEELTPDPDVLVDFDPGIQNGGYESDGIRIVADDGTVIDTLLYDSPNTNNLPGDGGYDPYPDEMCAPDAARGLGLSRDGLHTDTDNCLADFAIVPPYWCADADGDGYYDEACGGDDCDDTDPDVNPGATEGPLEDPSCSDGIDNDCDGYVDLDDWGCEPAATTTTLPQTTTTTLAPTTTTTLAPTTTTLAPTTTTTLAPTTTTLAPTTTTTLAPTTTTLAPTTTTLPPTTTTTLPPTTTTTTTTPVTTTTTTLPSCEYVSVTVVPKDEQGDDRTVGSLQFYIEWDPDYAKIVGYTDDTSGGWMFNMISDEGQTWESGLAWIVALRLSGTPGELHLGDIYFEKIGEGSPELSYYWQYIRTTADEGSEDITEYSSIEYDPSSLECLQK